LLIYEYVLPLQWIYNIVTKFLLIFNLYYNHYSKNKTSSIISKLYKVIFFPTLIPFRVPYLYSFTTLILIYNSTHDLSDQKKINGNIEKQCLRPLEGIQIFLQEKTLINIKNETKEKQLIIIFSPFGVSS
jgi:hypothetical protein